MYINFSVSELMLFWTFMRLYYVSFRKAVPKEKKITYWLTVCRENGALEVSTF